MSASLQPIRAMCMTLTLLASSSAIAQSTDAGTDAATAAVDAVVATDSSLAADAAPVDLPIDIAAPSVVASVSSATVRLGTPFTLFITATFRSDVVVNIADPLDLGPAFELRRRTSIDQPRTDGKIERQWQLEVLPWELGDNAIPPMSVTFTIGGNAGHVETTALAIHVEGTLGEVDDNKLMRPSMPPRSILQRSWFWLYVAMAATVVLALGLIGAVAVRRRRAARVRITGGVVAWQILDEAGRIALEKITAIEESSQLDTDPVAGYAALADVLREFAGRRYRFAVMDRTSREWLSLLGSSAPDAVHSSFVRWFDPADKVKYAATPTSVVEAKAASSSARQLVIDTVRSTSDHGPSVEPTASVES
jgi:hypothetical protein